MRLYTLLFIICLTGFHASGKTDTLHFRFPLNVYALNKDIKDKIDLLVYNDVISIRHSILIIGYADHLGSTGHNEVLSLRRANSIKAYLQDLNIPAGNIELCIGKGEINRAINAAEGYAPDRKVDLVITKLVTEPASPPASRQAIVNTYGISLKDKKAGDTIRLNNIHFLLGRHAMTDASLPALNNLYQALADNARLKIQVEGHICCLRYGQDAIDEDTGEIALSVNRAKYIYDFLVAKGIDKNRISYKGFGKLRPLVMPERTSADEDRNRRVEIRIVEK